jgi:spermidine/putrescine-binding protein
MQAEGIPVEYMVPKEGILTWACGLMALKDHPGPEQAMVDLIDAMQSPETGAWVLSSLGVGHSNRKAFALADPEILRSIGMADPETLFAKGVPFRAMDDALRETYEKLLLEVKAGG